jgi:hypothetical protein
VHHQALQWYVCCLSWGREVVALTHTHTHTQTHTPLSATPLPHHPLRGVTTPPSPNTNPRCWGGAPMPDTTGCKGPCRSGTRHWCHSGVLTLGDPVVGPVQTHPACKPPANPQSGHFHWGVGVLCHTPLLPYRHPHAQASPTHQTHTRYTPGCVPQSHPKEAGTEHTKGHYTCRQGASHLILQWAATMPVYRSSPMSISGTSPGHPKRLTPSSPITPAR